MEPRDRRDWLPGNTQAWIATVKQPLRHFDGTIIGTWVSRAT